MPMCPNGHPSVAEDWCEVCGHRIGIPSPEPGATIPAELCPQCRTPRDAYAPFCEECRYNFLTHSPTASTRPSQPDPAPPTAPSPGRGEQPDPPSGQAPGSTGDWLLPPPAAPAQPRTPDPRMGPAAPGGSGTEPGWLVAIRPDRDYFAAMLRRSGPEAASLDLPAYAPEQRVPLTGQQITIGRRRQSTGEAPDIDLCGPPEDPGVSHQHAILVRRPGGGWSVVDQDSTNGTTVNGAEEPIQPFVPVPLRVGDRIHVGAWTTLTLHQA